jgi:hypothetical protein
MALRSLRHTRWLAIVGACAAIACSSSKAATPDAWVQATVVGTGGTCNVSNGSILSVGEMSPSPLGKPGTTASGGADMIGTVTITCSVTSSGMGFALQLSVVQTGPMGGSLTVQGTVTETGGTVSGNFQSPLTGQYSQSDCTFTPTFLGGPIPLAKGDMPVAGGRIWGHVSCPVAQDPYMNQSNGMPIICDAEADFLLENCSGS